MSELKSAIVDTCARVFAEMARAGDDWNACYDLAAQAGLDRLLIDEESGGIGGDWSDAIAVIEESGRYALHFPIAEFLVSSAYRSLIDDPAGLITFAEQCAGRIDPLGRFSGALSGVAWGEAAEVAIGRLDGETIALRIADGERVGRAVNPAREPRTRLNYSERTAVRLEARDPIEILALCRAAQMAGALAASLELSVTYANTRVQFGRPIGKFQSVQQSLAVFAEEVTATKAAVDGAALALDNGNAALEIAAAKLRANRASRIGAAIAHQVHGAIGFTAEHPLQLLTKRLHSWRSEFGNEGFWAAHLGKAFAALGADQIWPTITQRADRNWDAERGEQ
ncbi:MAG: acyl-CoA dehydrogenase family protein [Hyphomonadaceae bacterium]|nr:acyl-CoA dehydrogenase family protein [Hyphomonadaceae bacterium]